MPVSIPEAAKRIGESSSSRVSSTASAMTASWTPLSSPSPGASAGTIQSAVRKISAANAMVPIITQLSTMLASRQAAYSPRSLSTRAKTGMNALASVAPASSWKTRSGSRIATQKASSSTVAPYWSAITTARAAPSRRLPRNASPSSSAAPATPPAGPKSRSRSGGRRRGGRGMVGVAMRAGRSSRRGLVGH